MLSLHKKNKNVWYCFSIAKLRNSKFDFMLSQIAISLVKLNLSTAEYLFKSKKFFFFFFFLAINHGTIIKLHLNKSCKNNKIKYRQHNVVFKLAKNKLISNYHMQFAIFLVTRCVNNTLSNKTKYYFFFFFFFYIYIQINVINTLCVICFTNVVWTVGFFENKNYHNFKG